METRQTGRTAVLDDRGAAPAPTGGPREETGRPRRRTTPRQAARIAGAAYLAIFVLAMFANFVVRNGLVHPDDAGATVRDIVDAEGLFRLGLLAFLVVFALDVVIAWALHIVFRDTDPDLSRLAAWFRVVYTVLLGVGLVFFSVVLELLGGAEHLGAFDDAQVASQVMVALDAFDAAWLIGLAGFGVHLVLVGWMILRSGVASRALGFLLALAGVAYVADTTANALLAGYDDLASLLLVVVAVPSVIGELWFGLWLVRGGDRRSPVPV